MNIFSKKLRNAQFVAAGLACAILPNHAFSQAVQYDIRAQTTDKVRAVTGQARQGSFGAPAINDRGSVAYACILSGNSVGALSTYSVVTRRAGKKAAKVALQGGVRAAIPTGPEETEQIILTNDPRTINNNFLIDTNNSANIFPRINSGRMYRISRTVAINSRNQIAFSGQLIFDTQSNTLEEGVVTDFEFNDASYSAIGVILPLRKTFTNTAIATYDNYFADILTRNISINQTGAVPYTASFRITPEEILPGFGYGAPTYGLSPVATTASNVIGLPYFTTFQSFSYPIIANKNVCYLVADISDQGDEFDGIWQGTNPNLQPVIVKNTPAPGGGTFASFEATVAPSPNGNLVAFIANVTGGDTTRGVYRSTRRGDSPILVAGIGQPAPGTGQNFATLELASVSNRGQVAILGTVQDGNRELIGIWLSDNSGKNLRLLALEGQTIPIGNSRKILNRITFSPVSAINRRGQVAFTASFTDRTSAVIVAR